jgi:predicted  nucleic acid-binding Zn-ribbon protein
LNEQISLLIQLQNIDFDLDKLTEEYDSIPVKIEQIKNTINESKANYEKNKNEIKQLQLELKKFELELKAKEDEIKKYKIELNSVKTNEQYNALLLEIKKCEEIKDKTESEILLLLDKIDNSNLEIKNLEKELLKIESSNNEAIKDLENKRVELEKELSIKKQKREDFIKKISPNILKKYEHIRESRDGIALSLITDGACSSCHIKLPPQVINEVTKVITATQIYELVYCENCSRILYIENINTEHINEKNI